MYFRLIDEKDGKEKCYFPLDTKQFGKKRAVVLAKMHRDKNGVWIYTPIGEVLPGMHHCQPSDMIAEVTNRYVRGRYKNKEFIFRG